MSASLPTDEAGRLAALRRYHILDTSPEDAFDNLTWLAAEACETPSALISFVDADRLWFKSRVDFHLLQVARANSFCSSSLLETDVLVVPDARLDNRFAASEMVTNGAGVRFYAGAQLRTGDNHTLGTLCVIDRVPREFSLQHRRRLCVLAQQVVAQLELRCQATRNSTVTKHEGSTNCRSAGKNLRRSEDYYRQLFEKSHSFFCIHDHDGVVLSVNAAGAQSLGYEPEEIIGRNLKDYLTTAARLRWDDYMKQCLGLPTCNGLMHLVTRDGREVTWAYRNSRYDGDANEQPFIIGNAHEVAGKRAAREVLRQAKNELELKVAERTAELEQTNRQLEFELAEHKRTTEKLRESEEQFRLMFENSPVGIYRTTHDGRIAMANPALIDMLGFSSFDDLAKRNLETDSRELTYERSRFKETIESRGEIKGWEATWQKRSGANICVRENARVVRNGDGTTLYYEGIVEDITEHKRTEQALQTSEARYRLLFESNPQPMWVFDFETLRFLAVNHAAISHYGYSEEEFLSMTIKDVRPAEEVPELLNGIAKVTEGLHTNIPWRHRRKDGTIIHVEVSGHTINFAGRQSGLVLINDVTERKLLEEQLRQSQKMEAVGQLAGGVAHDFNNLLAVITGYSSLLLRRLPPEDRSRSKIEEISRAADRAAALTRQLLTFSRKQVLQPKVINLNAIITDMHKMLRRLIGEDIDLVAQLPTLLSQVKADPGQIEQVVMNLVVNARDAMPEGGRLLIETQNVTLDEDYTRRHSNVPPGAYVLLAVTDTGCGMDAQTQARIFEPFYTTKEQGKGTGLGLSTVYGIVKQSSGYVWVYSEPGRGTTFKIYLPRVDEAVDSEKVSSTCEAAHGSETVLLVEDEDAVRAMAREMLEESGYTVLEAANGTQALALRDAYDKTIHLLVTDVVMPQMSGRELAEQLAQRVTATHPSVRVLYMSGYTDGAISRHDVLEAGAAFIQKPFAPEALLRKVREVLDA